jgi:hypothetical protein
MTAVIQSQTPSQPDMPLTFNLAALHRYFWQTNVTMAIFLYASIAALVVAVIGMAVDSRTVFGVSTWAKTAKFSLSFIAYAPTMYWIYSHITIRPRLKSFVMHSTAAILLLELVLLMLQGARGQAMHYNISTPFNATLWGIMSTTIAVFYFISFIGAGLLVVQQLKDRTYGLALRLGMGLMLLGFGLGYIMAGAPTPEQMAVFEAGGTPDFIGGHTIGAPDGGAGIPFLGWSTEHGDLRIAHFVGIHGAQFMLLAGWGVTLLAGRMALSEGRKLALVWGLFGGYLGLTLLVTWQGLRAESLFQPSTLTLTAFAALVAVTLAYLGGVLATGRHTATTH